MTCGGKNKINGWLFTMHNMLYLSQKRTVREMEIEKGGTFRTVLNIKRNKGHRKVIIPNRLSKSKNTAMEMAEREDIIERTVKVYRKMLPRILNNLSRIKDPRNVSYIKHQMTVLLAYGILSFVLMVGSRRNANKEMSKGILKENLQDMFPELASLPHADSLSRLLERIEDISEIQNCLIELLKDLIKQKKFDNNLINGQYLIAVDGTQKQTRNYKYAEEALHKNCKNGERYYTYVVEAVLILDTGVALPFMSEILENEANSIQFNTITNETEKNIKQDCENKGFKRLAERIQKEFPQLPITIVGDGLYANGPIIEICKKNKWNYMLVLRDDALPDVWKEANGLIRYEQENKLDVEWGDRKQKYKWVNDIEYEYRNSDTKRYKYHKLNVVICDEEWTETHPRSTKEVERKIAKYAWISSVPIDNKNVFFRCTKIARWRWKIENYILKEKQQGYNYEHFYSYNWNAMKGYHYLMQIGHLINALAFSSDLLVSKIIEYGIRGFVDVLKKACGGARICNEKIRGFREKKYIFRLALAYEWEERYS